MNQSNNFEFVPDEVAQESPTHQNNFQFEPEPIVSKEKTTRNEPLRHVARSTSRAVESIAGLPGDVLNLLKTGFQYGASKLGEKGKLLSEAIQKSPNSSMFPTSESLREKGKNLFGDYLEPQDEGEETSDEIISDIATLALPVKGKIPFVRAIGTALAANASKQTAKAFGASDDAQTATKIGSMFMAGLLGRKNADKFVQNLYQDSKSKIPKGTMMPTGDLIHRLEQTEKTLSKGISTTTKKQVLDDVRQLKQKAIGGAVPMEDLVQTYHDINETMLSKRLFEDLSKTEQKLLRTRFNLFKDDVTKTIEDYGRYNPEFLKSWKDANQGYAAISQSKKVSKILSKAVKTKHSFAASPALILFETLNPTAIIPTVSAGLGGYGTMKSGELIYRFIKSPVLQKHYINLVKEASKDNLAGVIRNLEALDEAIKRKEKTSSQDE